MTAHEEHEHFRRLMSEHLDGLLAEPQVRELEQHLAGCRQCREEFALLRRSVQLLRNLPQVEVPEELRHRLHRRLLRHGAAMRRRSSTSRWMVPFEATMAVLLATVGAIVLVLLVSSFPVTVTVPRGTLLELSVNRPERLYRLAESAWRSGGTVRRQGHLVPKGSRLGASGQLELWIPRPRWGDFLAAAGELVPAPALPAHLPPTGEQQVLVLVRLVRPARSGPRSGAGPASTPTPPKTPRGRQPPPPGGRAR
ncbi:MAG: hypothetical protein DRI34_13260 [Deltaproteobacteria bacterium]|nr:MAG: hypothetical protein DRI34_13260 [Deltaproteobacteria bacterium]